MKFIWTTSLFVFTCATLACSSVETIETKPDVNAEQTSKPAFSPSPFPEIPDEFVRKQWTERYQELKEDILTAQTRWNSQRIRNYSFVATKQRAGHTSIWNRSPVRISVADGQKASIVLVNPSDRTNQARTDGFEDFDSIDKLFTYMLQELETGFLVRSEFDQRLGYPRNVSIIEFLGPHGGRSIDITDFKPLNNHAN